MGRVFRFATGFGFGLAFGALLALMWAPHTGPELRAQVEERFLMVMEEGRRAAETRRKELLKQIQEASRVPGPAKPRAPSRLRHRAASL